MAICGLQLYEKSNPTQKVLFLINTAHHLKRRFLNLLTIRGKGKPHELITAPDLWFNWKGVSMHGNFLSFLRGQRLELRLLHWITRIIILGKIQLRRAQKVSALIYVKTEARRQLSDSAYCNKTTSCINACMWNLNVLSQSVQSVTDWKSRERAVLSLNPIAHPPCCRLLSRSLC